MSAPPATVTAWQWPADILDFAARSQVEAYLNPLLDATRRLFPTARDLRVMLEADPEIRDDWHIVFDVRVPRADVPHFVNAQHFRIDELYRTCPAPPVCTFPRGLVAE